MPIDVAPYQAFCHIIIPEALFILNLDWLVCIVKTYLDGIPALYGQGLLLSGLLSASCHQQACQEYK
jgi:hypothetical protein